MNQLKQILILVLLIPILACGNKQSNVIPEADKKNVSSTETKTSPENKTATDTQNGSLTEQLEKAKKDGKTVFLVITGTGATGVDKALAIVREANAKVNNSIILQLNKNDNVNNNLVSKFRIAAVPIPFILVISPKGLAVSGGPPSQVTSDQLIKTIPSPKQDEVFFSLSESKPVFIVVSKKGYNDKTGIISNCETAGSKISSKPNVIEIDFEDNNEKAFLSQIGVTSIKGKTITVVINSSGQITETFAEKPAVEKLTAASNKVMQSSGCCPSTTDKSGCK